MLLEFLIVGVVQKEMSDQGQSPSRNLHLGGMTIKGGGRPSVDYTMPDHLAWDLQNDCRNIAFGEKVLPVEERFAAVALFFVECIEETMQREGIPREHVGGDSNKRLHS